jgi:hypothetical protein
LHIMLAPKRWQFVGRWPGVLIMYPLANGWTVVGIWPGVLIIAPLPNGWIIVGGCTAGATGWIGKHGGWAKPPHAWADAVVAHTASRVKMRRRMYWPSVVGGRFSASS